MTNIGRELLTVFGSDLTKAIDRERSFYVSGSRSLLTSSDFNNISGLYISTIIMIKTW